MSKFTKTLGSDKYASVNSIRKCVANGTFYGNLAILVYSTCLPCTL